MLKCWAEGKVESQCVCLWAWQCHVQSAFNWKFLQHICCFVNGFAIHMFACITVCVCVSWFSLKYGMWKFNRHLFHLLKCFCSRSGAQTANCNFNCNNREIIHTHTHVHVHWLTCVCNWIAISVCWVTSRLQKLLDWLINIKESCSRQTARLKLLKFFFFFPFNCVHAHLNLCFVHFLWTL